MPQQLDELDGVFHALGDATRRGVIERLVAGPASTSDLARPFAMALPSFTQHLAVLERAALVTSTKHGRVRTYQLTPGALELAGGWLAAQRRAWEQRLDRFDTFVTALHRQQTDEQTGDEQPTDQQTPHQQRKPQ